MQSESLHIVSWVDQKTGTYVEPINRPRVKFRNKIKKIYIYRSAVIQLPGEAGDASCRAIVGQLPNQHTIVGTKIGAKIYQ